MAGNPQILVEYRSDTSGLAKGLKTSERGISKFGSTIKRLGKVGAVAAGAAGIGALVATMKIGIDEFTEAAKVTAQTEAVIKSTGKSAGVTAQQVTDLSEAIMAKTGIDDEAIQSGQNMLLTFQNVRNEVGKGNDVYNQAVETMTDMSVALGQDMPTSAMQLGKALNDPIRGITALRRVGVQFTEAQEKSIEAMVESGDVMGAQKLILEELNDEFGKSAEAVGKTLPGQLAIMREEFNNIAGDLASRFMPTIVDVARGALDFVKKFSDAEGAVAKFKVVIDGVKKVAGSLYGAIRDAVAKIDWGAIWERAKGLADGLQNAVANIDWAGVGKTIGTALAGAVALAAPAIRDAFAKVFAIAREIDWVAFGRAVGPGLAAALVTAFTTLLDPAFWAKNWDLALAVGLAAFPVGRIVGKLAAPLARAGADLVRSIADGIGRGAPRLAEALITGLSKLPGLITSMGSKLAGLVGSLFGRLGRLATFTIKVLGIQAVIQAVSQLVSAIKDKLGDMVSAIGSFVGRATSAAVRVGKGIVNGIKNGIANIVSTVRTFLSNAANAVKGFVGAALSAGAAVGAAIVQGMINGLQSLAGALYAQARSIAQGAIDAAKSFLHIGSPSRLWAELGADTIRGYILGITQEQPKLNEKTAEAMQKALDAARARVEKQQEKFRATFDKLGEYAARAFEGRTRAILDKITARFDAAIAEWQGYADALTPAEKQLAEIQAREAQLSRDAAVAAAQAAVNTADTAEARNAALEQLRQANLANEIAALEATAAAERLAQQATAAEKIKALEEEKARELQNAEEIRRLRAEKLDEQLANLRERLAKHPEEHKKIQKKILALLDKFGVDYEQAGLDMGTAFAAGLENSVEAVKKAAKKLADIVAQYLPHSPAEKGPLARTDFFRGFGDMLAGNLLSGAGALNAAAARMAGGAAGGLGGSLYAPAIEGGPVSTQVRVYIGDQELRGLVRYEVVDQNTRMAQTLLAGRA